MFLLGTHGQNIITRSQLETKMDDIKSDIRAVLSDRKVPLEYKNTLERLSFDVNTAALGCNIEIPHDRTRINDRLDDVIIRFGRVKIKLSKGT
jgi:hypothetical protein